MKRLIILALLLCAGVTFAAEPFPVILRIEDGGSSTEIPGALTWQELDYWGQNLRVLFRGEFPDGTDVQDYSFYLPYSALDAADCDSSAELGTIQVDSAAGAGGNWLCWCNGLSGWQCTGSSAVGTANILDLADDASNESTDLIEIATTGDTNAIFAEPTADKLLIDLTKAWPLADAATALAANGSNCSTGSAALGVDASGASEGCFDVLEPTEIDTEAELEAFLTDVTDIFTNNDAASGYVEIAPSAAQTITPAADATGLIVKESVAQTANIFEVQDETGTTVFLVDPGGDVRTDNGTATGKLRIGEGSVAAGLGSGSIAIGKDANAARDGLAIGVSADADLRSIAIGDSVWAPNDSIAIGKSASALNSGTVVGNGASGNVSFGENASSAGSGSIAIGTNASSPSGLSFALGTGSSTTGTFSIALGNQASTTASGGIAIGQSSEAGALGSVAIGRTAESVASGQLVFGNDLSSGSDPTLDSLRLGGVDGPQMVAGGVTVYSREAEGTDVNGNNLALYAGTSTGTGTAGSLSFNVSKPGLTGATKNPYSTLLTLDGSDASAKPAGNWDWTSATVSNLNANTATALAANGTNCGTGQFAQGVDAGGNAEGCVAPFAGGGAVASLHDADDDTRVVVEQSADDDLVSVYSNAKKTIEVDAKTLSSKPQVTVNPSANNTELVVLDDVGSALLRSSPQGAPAQITYGGTQNFTGSIETGIDSAAALDANGTNCAAGSGAGGIDASGNAEDCTDYLGATETAATATALAANGANCSTGNAPLGVDASGAAEGCFAVATPSAGTFIMKDPPLTADNTIQPTSGTADPLTVNDSSGVKLFAIEADGDILFPATDPGVTVPDDAIRIGRGADVGPDNYGLAIGTQADARGADSVVVGRTATAIGDQCALLGFDTKCGAAQGVAIGSEAGDATTASSTKSISIGHQTDAIGGASIAIGEGTQTTGVSAIGIGTNGTTASTVYAIAMGYDTDVSGNQSIGIGRNADVAGHEAVAIGRSAQAGHDYSVAIGRAAQSTAANQFVVGGNGGQISDAYIGNGVTNAAPGDIRIHSTQGSGTDIAGADIYLRGGAGTGTGSGGTQHFQSAPAGLTGTALNSYVDVVTIDGEGDLTIWGNPLELLKTDYSADTITVKGTWDFSAATESGVDSATALAANGTNCAAGQWAAGVDASGNAEGCTADDTGTDSDDDLSNNQIGDLNDVSETGADAGEALVSDGAGGWSPSAATACLSDGTNCPSSSSVLVLDLADDDSNESVALDEIATTGDTNSIFTEPVANKLLINAGNNWPTADAATALSANGANCSPGNAPLGVDASGAAESCFDVLEASEVDSEAELEALLLDVTNVLTDSENAASATALAADGTNCAAGQWAAGVDASGNAQGCTVDDTGTDTLDDLSNNDLGDLQNVTEVGEGSNIALVGDGTGGWQPGTPATATALAANGANCAAGQWAAGVDASGASEGCTADDDAPDDDSEVPDAITVAGGSVSTSTITLDTGADPTADGQIRWDSTTERIEVGDDGAATLEFYSGAHTTDTNANTICTGTDVYLDGEGNCDTISGGGAEDYAEMSIRGNSTATTISSTGVYVKVTAGWATGLVSGWTFSTDKLTSPSTAPGVCLVTWTVTIDSITDSDQIELTVFQGGSAQAKCSGVLDVNEDIGGGTTLDWATFGGQCLLNIGSSEDLDLRIRNNSDTSNQEVEDASLIAWCR